MACLNVPTARGKNVEGSASTPDSTWTPEAVDIVARACEHYGGMQAWRAIRRLRMVPERLSGLVPWLKGSGRTFSLPASFEICPRARWTRLVGFPDAEHTGVFEDGAIWIERRDNATVIARSSEHRQTMTGKKGTRRWLPMDALYFLGYAAAHYCALPFGLLDARLLGVRRMAMAGRATALEVEFPESLHTHSRRQTFYFDAECNLVRHDYVAEPVGPWAHGAHFWHRQARVDGMLIALERQVRVRVGSMATPIMALHLTLSHPEVEYDTAQRARESVVKGAPRSLESL